MAKWMRCKASMTLRPRGSEAAEYLWPDKVVNFERELAPGFTVGDAVAGREDCFEPTDDPTTAPIEPETVLQPETIRTIVQTAPDAVKE